MIHARRFAIAALITLALTVASPTLADHSYSHRLVFEGRVVDSNGIPLPAEEVTFFSSDGRLESRCASAPPGGITDEWGDFRFCIHAHELDPATIVGVRVRDTWVNKSMDTAMRRSVVTVIVPDATGEAPPEWNATFRAAGRVWRAGAGVDEGVPVYGRVQPNVPVNLTLHLPGGQTTRFDLVTDGYGDFDATFQLAEGVDPASVIVHAETLGFDQTRPLDTFSHRITIGFLLPAGPNEGDASFVDASWPGLDERPPGSTSPPLGLGVVSVMALMAFIAVRASRKKT